MRGVIIPFKSNAKKGLPATEAPFLTEQRILAGNLLAVARSAPRVNKIDPKVLHEVTEKY
jgi:hypothetical protein